MTLSEKLQAEADQEDTLEVEAEELEAEEVEAEEEEADGEEAVAGKHCYVNVICTITPVGDI